MNQDLDLVELFAFSLAFELERNPIKLINIFFSIIECLFNTKNSKIIKRHINYGKLLKKYGKIKSFFRQQFFHELENYNIYDCCSNNNNETSRNMHLKFSFLWSLICSANMTGEQKFKAMDRISDMLYEEGHEIFIEKSVMSDFYDKIYVIQNYCINSGLNLEIDKLDKYFTPIKDIGKGSFGKVREFCCVKSKNIYAIKTVKLEGESIIKRI